MEKYKQVGSKVAKPITKLQKDKIVSIFMSRNDIRMAIVCEFLWESIKIKDILSLDVRDVYDSSGFVHKHIVFRNKKYTVKDKMLILLEKYKGCINTNDGYSALFVTKKNHTRLQDSGVKKMLRLYSGLDQCSPLSFKKGAILEINKKNEIITDLDFYNHDDFFCRVWE